MNTLHIDYFQVDMSAKGVSTCAACDTIQQKLDQAIHAVRPLLSDLNVKIEKRTFTIRTEEEANRHNVVASPTIRAGSFDFFPEHLRMKGEERVWSWKDETFSEPSREIFIGVILKGYLGEAEQKEKTEISPYVMQFFDDQPETAGAQGCCS